MSSLFTLDERNDLRIRRFDPNQSGFGPEEARNAILFGAGGGGRFFLRFMREAGVEPRAFVDNAQELWGTQVDGIPVFPPSELTCSDVSRVILCTAFALREQVEQCQQLGVKNFVPYFNFCQNPFPFVVATEVEVEAIFNDDEINALNDLWGDEKSRQVYKGTLAFRVTQDVQDMPSYQRGEYFLSEFFTLADYRRFVDGGAFTGDTLEELLEIMDGKIERYYGFEPDPENYRILEQGRDALPKNLAGRIQNYPIALGEDEGEVSLQGLGNACSAIGQDGLLRVLMNSIDNVLGEDECPTMIKLEIEVAEPAALKGMEKTIRRCRPALAICVYHEVDHLWKLPLWVHQLGVGYRLFLRKHSESYSETVCYAVPS
jgi:FkbM family methyltransferase